MLPKSLRNKKRYILCRIIFIKKRKINDVNKELRLLFFKHIFTLYGDVGASKINPKIIELNDKEKDIYFIVMCNYNYTEHVQFALANIGKLKEEKIIINILGVSGTQKKLNKFLAACIVPNFTPFFP